MTEDEGRRRFATASVARLATVDPDCRPHLVPIVFVVAGQTVYTAVDDKPKRSTALRRLANVRANPAVAVLVDHYDDDWRTLWWVRADGAGRVVTMAEPEAQQAVSLLASRYARYLSHPPLGPVLAIDVERWSTWAAVT
jgi:PPOX class probable F420-dependent enzyme